MREERAVAMLMIKCPRTGQDVSTGILTDPDSYRKIPEALVQTRCSHCGLEHAWSPEDAWLAAEGSLEGLLDNDQRAKTGRCGL
jgi:hypothetical protein